MKNLRYISPQRWIWAALTLFMVLNMFLCTSAVEIGNSTNPTDVVVGNDTKNDISINMIKNSSNVFYVSVGGNDSNDGLSEATSKRSIQKAIQKAPKKVETTIIVKSGVYYENIIIPGEKNIILRGTNATINGNAKNICIYVRKGSNVILNGFTITNGTTKLGGSGISNQGILTVENSTIIGNKATFGGGIYNGLELFITDSLIKNNNADNAGGILNKGKLTINDSIIQANNATNGGGIYTLNGKLSVYNSAITGNNATNGGGLYTYTDNLKVYNSTICNNVATGNGGGLYSVYGEKLRFCVFEGNSASNGGAIFINKGSCSCIACIFKANVAQNYGGAIHFNRDKFLQIINCVFEDNTANHGGAIALKGTLKDYYTSIFTNNKPTDVYKVT